MCSYGQNKVIPIAWIINTPAQKDGRPIYKDNKILFII
jgi:hypothetical protein